MDDAEFGSEATISGFRTLLCESGGFCEVMSVVFFLMDRCYKFLSVFGKDVDQRTVVWHMERVNSSIRRGGLQTT